MPNLVGFGITLPHKQTAIDLCDSLDQVAAGSALSTSSGANAMVAFEGLPVRCAKALCGPSIERDCDRGSSMLSSSRAGGASVAIAFALVEAGANSITVSDRTFEKAEALAETVNADFGRTVARLASPSRKLGNSSSMPRRSAFKILTRYRSIRNSCSPG